MEPGIADHVWSRVIDNTPETCRKASKNGDTGRFMKFIGNVFDNRLTYRKLIGDNDALPV